MVHTQELQLVTVDLENGQRGIFVGVPLVEESVAESDCQVEAIWFSDVQEIPRHLTVNELIQLLRAHLLHSRPALQ